MKAEIKAADVAGRYEAVCPVCLPVTPLEMRFRPNGDRDEPAAYNLFWKIIKRKQPT
jgi:hypothetical protein